MVLCSCNTETTKKGFSTGTTGVTQVESWRMMKTLKKLLDANSLKKQITLQAYFLPL